jgi:hypothetical protein
MISWVREDLTPTYSRTIGKRDKPQDSGLDLLYLAKLTDEHLALLRDYVARTSP